MAKTADVPHVERATYLGVEDYGVIPSFRPETFHYTFQTAEGGRLVLRIPEDSAYPLQNQLKRGYRYELEVQNGQLIALDLLDAPVMEETEPGSGVLRIREAKQVYVPGRRTLGNFLRCALAPVGRVLYIYGGGWNWQDDAAAPQARSIGLSADWLRFFEEQDDSFTYKDKDDQEAQRDPVNSYYPFGGWNEYYYAGLDCSGYVGWAVYNAMYDRDGLPGYVMPATRMAKTFADYGWGTLQKKRFREDTFLPGDIVSIRGHVWISLGTCGDGSILIAHSTPSLSRSGQPGGGVQVGAVGEDHSCEAYQLAKRYMKAACPRWYERYGAALKAPADYTDFSAEGTGVFSWDAKKGAGLQDPDHVRERKPAALLDL